MTNQTRQHGFSNIIAVVALAAAGLAFARAEANRAQPLAPAVVATVDIERIFRDVDAGEAVDAALLATAQQLDIQAQAQRDEIALMTEDLQLYAPGSSEFQELEQTVARKTLELRAFQEFATRKIDAEKSKALLGLYQDIRDEIAAVSSEFGYDIVFVDDSVVPLPRGASEQDTMRQISARRMLFASQRIDITDLVLARMNG